MAPAGYATLWEFSVVPARQAEFESHYGPEGRWAALFRQAPGYLGTELLRDRMDPLRYVTIDRWSSADAWRDFRRRFAAEYERLDREFEGLTTREAPLGEYLPAGPGASR
jgi:heme-degrading monooxygenase HmoA